MPDRSRSPENNDEGPSEKRVRPPASSHIWNSKIGRRITLIVFGVSLLLQAIWLYQSTISYEADLLAKVKENGLVAVLQHMPKKTDALLNQPPFGREEAERIFKTSSVRGLAVFGLDQSNVLSYFGETAVTQSQDMFTREAPYRSADLSRYEVVYTSVDLSGPYNVLAVLDTSSVAPAVADNMRQIALIALLMSGLATTLLMLVMGQWILEPVFLLRNNLLNASKNPKSPDIYDARRAPRDEIGTTLRVANDLIRKNSGNLRQLEQQTADKIHRLAYYDTLTGLPNRTFFVEKLEEGIKHQILKENRRMAVFVVDIDHFKDINDTMGHEIGDKLLEAVGKRLTNVVPRDTIVARASADEFAVMMTLEHGDGSVTIDEIRRALAMPISVLRELFEIRVSIGVTYCPDDGTNAAQILKNADIALNRAKNEGRDTIRHYSEDFDLSVQKRFQILRDLRLAVDNDELMLHFHPQFDLASGEIIGTEALLRWRRPDGMGGGTMVSPAEFIPVAEQSGLIVPIGEWVLKTACKATKSWQEKNGLYFCMAVNISGVQFHRSNIVETVDRVLKETGLDPQYLELEVTESVFMEDVDTTIDILNQLHDLGVKLSIDDFGTGYSSLNYLRQFPIDRLKIDQSFIRSSLINESAATITRAIITLGHSLNLKVIAEGVETADHEDFLKREGCDEVQGFKYTKPLPADKLWDFIATYNENLAKKPARLVK